jgi:hypothetical protein
VALQSCILLMILLPLTLYTASDEIYAWASKNKRSAHGSFGRPTPALIKAVQHQGHLFWKRKWFLSGLSDRSAVLHST